MTLGNKSFSAEEKKANCLGFKISFQVPTETEINVLLPDDQT